VGIPEGKEAAMPRITAADVLDMTVRERLALVSDILNTIAEDTDLTVEDKQVLDERLAMLDRDPNSTIPWNEVDAWLTKRN
jgi:putative addiction module component (TIGR02574 family)